MINIIASIFGAAGAIIFVGFFAYKVDQPPLTIIVVCCLALMLYSFYDDIRNDRTIARIRGERDGSQ